MGHNGSEDTWLHQTDAQGIQSRRTRGADLGTSGSPNLDRQFLEAQEHTAIYS
jgi:hypothetical protein